MMDVVEVLEDLVSDTYNDLKRQHKGIDAHEGFGRGFKRLEGVLEGLPDGNEVSNALGQAKRSLLEQMEVAAEDILVDE